ncbi:hypothetical protein [Streptomyces nigra]|uniref:hypothetical protein n=1 Tax=Streptomyces nigra TaxID=1827580 RepID=UPI0036ACECC5
MVRGLCGHLVRTDQPQPESFGPFGESAEAGTAFEEVAYEFAPCHHFAPDRCPVGVFIAFGQGDRRVIDRPDHS